MRPITRPCAVCGVMIQVATLKDRHCGPACSALEVRRQAAQEADLPFTHPERHPITPQQRAIQKRALRRRHG